MAKNNNSRSKRRKNKKYSSQESPWRTWVKRFLIGSGLILLLGLIAGGGLFTYYAASAPELTQENLTGEYTSELVDRDGEVFYTLGGRNREHASFEEYPQVLEDAVLAIEDQRFYDHNGIDPIGIARAAGGLIANGEIVSGGSTITQQLIKLSVFSTSEEDQTFERKAQEAWLAVQLENELSKEKILNLYYNKVHMGGNVYGMATAAQEYYGKHVSELELHEAALLAGMPAAPNYYDPYENPNEAKNRRDTVLYSMVDYGAITEQQAQQAYQIPVQEGLQQPSSEQDQNSIVFDGYITTVLEEVQEKTGLDPYTAGLTIHTNLDSDAQQLLYDVTHNQDIVQYPNEELQTASAVIDNDSGAILATLGGRHIEGHLSNNRATNLRRGIGSAIKPLTTYGPAIEYNQYSTHHQVVDEPYTVPGTDWELANYDNEYHGQMPIREALVDSRNIPTAKIFNEDLNWSNVEEFLTNLGIDPTRISAGEGGLVPQNAINGIMTPMQLAGAYSAFANGGTYTEPHAVHTVVTQDGEEIDLTPESNRAMSDYTAYMITDMLKGVVDNYASLEVPGLNHAGKTGTTNYTADQHEEYNIPDGGVPDSWFAGYTPNITMSVWTGYDQPYEQGNYLTNDDGTRQIPRLVYQAFMEQYTEGQENPDWQQPNSVIEEEVVAGSDPAEQATESTPDSETVTELFVRGNEPIEPQEDESNEDNQNEQEDQNTQDNQGEEDEDSQDNQEQEEQNQQSEEETSTPTPDSETESEDGSTDNQGDQQEGQDTSSEEDTENGNNNQENTSDDQDQTSNEGEENTQSPTPPENGDGGQSGESSGGNQDDEQSGSNEEQPGSGDQEGAPAESPTPPENEGNGQGNGASGGSQEDGQTSSNDQETESGDQGGNSGQSSGEQPDDSGQGGSSESSTQQNGSDSEDSATESSAQQNSNDDQGNNGSQNGSSGEESADSNNGEQTGQSGQTTSGESEENDQ